MLLFVEGVRYTGRWGGGGKKKRKKRFITRTTLNECFKSLGILNLRYVYTIMLIYSIGTNLKNSEILEINGEIKKEMRNEIHWANVKRILK